MPRFEGKISVITGESSGIGLATAKRFVKGGRLCLYYRPPASRTGRRPTDERCFPQPLESTIGVATSLLLFRAIRMADIFSLITPE